MTDYNYKLVYNGNLRWTDYRGPNPFYSPGIEVRLDIVTFDNSSQTICHIHNYHTRCMAEDDKHVKSTFSAFVGIGRLTHEIFGQLNTGNLYSYNEELEEWYSSLYVGYHKTARLVFLFSPYTYSGQNNVLFSPAVMWHHIPLVDCNKLPIVLAIPLTNIGVK